MTTSASKKQNLKTVVLHVLILFVTAFAGVLTTAKLGSSISTWAAVAVAGATAGVSSVTAYLSGVLNMVSASTGASK
jgi:putative effector of murein hydrolase LrgA (UPF0299 family)